MVLSEFSPITQRRASSRFDLPQPFGPTTPVSPGSIRKSVGVEEALEAEEARRSNFTARPFGSGGSTRRGFVTSASPQIIFRQAPPRFSGHIGVAQSIRGNEKPVRKWGLNALSRGSGPRFATAGLSAPFAIEPRLN